MMLTWRALDAIEQLRWQVGDELQRSMWIMPRREVWATALQASFLRRDSTSALIVVERAKSTWLARLLLARAVVSQAPAAAALNQALLSQTSLTGNRLTRERQEQARVARADAIAEVRRSNARLAAAIDPPRFHPSRLGELASRTGPFVFVEYLELGKGRGWMVWGTEQGALGQREIELSLDEEKTIRQLASIGGADHGVAGWIIHEGEGAVRALGPGLLPAGLADFAASRTTLLICASGELAIVPFAALDLTPGVPLLSSFATINIPSLTIASTLPPTDPGRRPPVILTCDPRGNLRYLQQQAEQLCQIWPDAKLLETGDATLRALRQYSDTGRLADARSLVVAAHGAPHPHDPVASGVLLGDGEVLNAGMLLGMHLPTLVEFWTCGSGAERPLAGDERLGLVTSALMAGARQVLASMWSLPDQDAALLSSEFHATLRRGTPSHEALRQAQLAAINKRRPFVSWAPLAVHGVP
jgi:hypothetical protein